MSELKPDNSADRVSDLAKGLPPDFRPMLKELRAIEYLFGERSGAQPHLRIVRGDYSDKDKRVLRIIIDNRLCIIFAPIPEGADLSNQPHLKSGDWQYIGDECGNFEGNFTEFDWNRRAEQKGRDK